MARAWKATGIEGTVAYGYRHTFATDALVDGVPDAQVAALLGHASTAMLHRHYRHLTSQAQTLKDALGRVRGKGESPGVPADGPGLPQDRREPD